MKEYITITVIVILLVINIVAFIMYTLDKMKAKRDGYRISEMMLLFIAFIGGSIGALMAMTMFRHKTQHKKFTWGVPGILFAQIMIGIVTYVCYLMNLVA